MTQRGLTPCGCHCERAPSSPCESRAREVSLGSPSNVEVTLRGASVIMVRHGTAGPTRVPRATSQEQVSLPAMPLVTVRPGTPGKAERLCRGPSCHCRSDTRSGNPGGDGLRLSLLSRKSRCTDPDKSSPAAHTWPPVLAMALGPPAGLCS